MSSKKYYKDINLIRLISCISVILYHLNILKGGYLAVCVFFVLTSYLSTISAFRKENFSLKKYYANRLSKIYMPLLIVVFITISVISFFNEITWFNLKPETTSVLLGYNNFWQLSANLDYFARHINSPFMHLWYISILVQFDLVFPLIYIILKKIGDKTKKIIPCIISVVISIIATLYFYNASQTANIMTTYYDTFTRIFSLLFGLTLGLIHYYYNPLILKKLKEKPFNKIIFYIYLIILIILYIKIDATSEFFSFAMIISTFIACRLISYGVINIDENNNILDKLIKSLSDISYEIYLVQYPVIFLFQYIKIDDLLKIPLMMILIILLSFIINFVINIRKRKKHKIIEYLIFIFIIVITLFGWYKYVIAVDHTEEMKTLETELAKNEEMLKKRQEEYALKKKQDESSWHETLNNLNDDKNKLKDVVTNLNIVGIGDSVMLGAINNLYEKFPNGYFDAKTSRTAWVANGILNDLKSKNILSDVVLLNLGANGDAPEHKKIEIMENLKESKVFWINVTNDKDVHVNDNLNKLKEKYNNLYIIDWSTISQEHPEYFLSDKIHLTNVGRQAYVDAIYNYIYETYLDEFDKQKEEIINSHMEEQKKKATFIGNDILLNSYNYIKNEFQDSNFIINSNFDFEKIKHELDNLKKDDSLNYKIVIALDKSIILSKEQYEELANIYNEHKIYILNIGDNYVFSKNNIYEIDFYEELINHVEYLMVDKIHLTTNGNIALSKYITENVRNN